MFLEKQSHKNGLMLIKEFLSEVVPMLHLRVGLLLSEEHSDFFLQLFVLIPPVVGISVSQYKPVLDGSLEGSQDPADVQGDRLGQLLALVWLGFFAADFGIFFFDIIYSF